MKLGFQDQNFDFHYENIVIENSSEEKLFGITREDKLNFECYIINICTVFCYIDSDKRKLLVNALVES